MVLAELAAFLETAGIGTRGVNLFYGQDVDTVDNAVWLLEYTGAAPDPKLGQGTVDEESPRVQINVRNLGYDAGRAKAEAIMVALVSIASGTLLSGTRYLSVLPTSQPSVLSRDKNDRWRFVLNVIAMKELS